MPKELKTLIGSIIIGTSLFAGSSYIWDSMLTMDVCLTDGTLVAVIFHSIKNLILS